MLHADPGKERQHVSITSSKIETGTAESVPREEKGNMGIFWDHPGRNAGKERGATGAVGAAREEVEKSHHEVKAELLQRALANMRAKVRLFGF